MINVWIRLQAISPSAGDRDTATSHCCRRSRLDTGPARSDDATKCHLVGHACGYGECEDSFVNHVNRLSYLIRMLSYTERIRMQQDANLDTKY